MIQNKVTALHHVKEKKQVATLSVLIAVVEGIMLVIARAEEDLDHLDATIEEEIIVAEAEVEADRILEEGEEIEEEIREETQEAMIETEMSPEVTIEIEETEETNTMIEEEREGTLETEMIAADHRQDIRDLIEMNTFLEVDEMLRAVQEVIEMATTETTQMIGTITIRMLIIQKMSQILSTELMNMIKVAMRVMFLTKKSRSMWTSKKKK